MKESPLLNCPREVQLSIVDFLPSCDLANLCLTSRALHSLVEPLLYSHIKIVWKKKWRPLLAHILLLRTLLERKDLCNHVSSLQFEGDGFDDAFKPPKPGQEPATPVIPSLPIPDLTGAMQQTGTSQPTIDTWIERVQSGCSDAVVGVTVTLLPKLERLALCANWTTNTDYLGTVFRSASNQHSSLAFGTLRFVSVAPNEEGDENLDPKNTLDALSLLYLPRIEHLSISIDNPTHFCWPSPSPPSPEFLTSLEIFRLRECRLAPILSATKNLKRLRYNWVYQPDRDEEISKHVVALDTMSEAFLQARDSLEELEVTADTIPAASRGEYEPPEIEFQGSLAGLDGMHKLKAMSIPWSFLIGMRRYPDTARLGRSIPPSLEHLTLGSYYIGDEESEDPDDDMISAFEIELEGGAVLHAKQLKKVTLPPSFEYSGFSDACRNRLESIGARFNLILDTQPIEG